jgi:hypothetical protein
MSVDGNTAMNTVLFTAMKSIPADEPGMLPNEAQSTSNLD